jgi:hypothetical protein
MAREFGGCCDDRMWDRISSLICFQFRRITADLSQVNGGYFFYYAYTVYLLQSALTHSDQIQG